MTPPSPISAGYKLVVSGLHACSPFTYVQDLPAAHASVVAWRLACTFYYFSSSLFVGWFIILYTPQGLGSLWYWTLHFFQPISWLSSCSVILSCHSCYNDLIMSGRFGPAVYSFPNGLTRPWAFLLMGSCVPFSLGHPWPICLPWASLALLLTLYSHRLLLTSLGFSSPISSYSSLGFLGLPSIPYSLWLHYFEPAAAHSYFFSHHTLPMGLLLTISLFRGSFELICFLKAHLLIPWTCDPLFLLLGLNSFFVLYLLPTSLCCWVWLPFLHLVFLKKRPSTGI